MRLCRGRESFASDRYSVWGISFLTPSRFRRSFFTRGEGARKETNVRPSGIDPLSLERELLHPGEILLFEIYSGRTYVCIYRLVGMLLAQTARATQRRTEIAARREKVRTTSEYL